MKCEFLPRKEHSGHFIRSKSADSKKGSGGAGRVTDLSCLEGLSDLTFR